MKYIFTLLALPVFANAQAVLGNTRRLVSGLKSLIETLVPLAFMLALLFFFWGVAKYIWSESNEDKGKGKQIMVWGVVAMFVISSVWGLVFFLRGELGVARDGGASQPMRIPSVGN